LSALLAASLGGRVLVGYWADRFQRKNTMAFFYLLLGGSIPLLFLAHQPVAAWTFAGIFGFAMGADYMLIPLLTADCFGIGSLGKILALIIMGYSLGQWIAPWAAGRLFDAYRSYDPAWKIMAIAAVLGAIAIYAVSVPHRKVAAAGAEMQ
jgi:MFS family permease